MSDFTGNGDRFVYLHYEGNTGPAFTVKHSLNYEKDQQSLDAVVNAFVAAYNKSPGAAKLDPRLVDLRHESGRIVSFVEASDDAMQHRDDIFVVDCPRRTTTTTTAKAAPAPSVPSSSSKPTDLNAAECVQRLRNLVDKKSYAEARRLCESAMKKLKDPMIGCILTEILIATGKFDAAVDHGEQAWESLQSAAARAASTLPSKRMSYVLALAYYKAGQFNDAWQKLREVTTSSEAPSRVAGSEAQNLDLDIIALQAECLFAAGRHTEAAGHINAHMNDAGAEEHMAILLAYSSFALQYGKMQEALRAMLKAVTLDQKNKRARKMLAEILHTDAGFEELTQQLSPSEASAAAYAFLATICKEFSAIPACIALFKIALSFRPDNAGYALNLMHAIELQYDFDAAIASVRGFLGNNQHLRAGKAGLTCGDLLSALDGTSRRIEDGAVVGYAVQWVDDKDRGYATTHAIVRQQGEGEGQEYTLCNDDTSAWLSASKEPLSDDALDVLAIGFTLIKLLYLQGRLSALPELYRVIEPTRHRSKKSLHETSIRNEHAYYQCIAQVLAYRLGCSTLGCGDGPAELRSPLAACCDPRSSPQYAEAAAQPIFTLGDSHCLSSAWSVLHIAGKPRLVVPKLITGVKHWHLRPESDFYPKFNFRYAIATVPDQADVIVIIGEIDCREGILMAVERDMYASVEEGMKSTLTIFAKVLSGMAATKKLRLLVHPVLPMLKETRSLVLGYNSFYREAVRKLKLTPPCAWLDFFDDLFVDDGEDVDVSDALRPGLVMDGTHISPSYCGLLEARINSSLSSTAAF